ncbi:MAG: hypothetical protein WB715_13180 [Roseiarcus sp.]|uniref:hypothetical protein n=1 Tax=Roseiarcus sp. TaxID=1969460 RepID=UPI003C67CB64
MRLICLILAIAGLVTSANAEFVMVSQPAAEIDARDPTPAANLRPKSTSRTLRRPAPQPVVAGFGDQVPLSFAVRQIVPARFQVAFGETVDSDTPVDWKGGKPWRPTLSDAVRPLGLTVSVVGATVKIQPARSAR